jgi:hypothetical protein
MIEKAAEDVNRLLDRPGLKQVVEVAEREQAGGHPPRQAGRGSQPPAGERHVDADSASARGNPRHRNSRPDRSDAGQFRYQ